MFKVLSDRGNANQNYTEIPSYPNQNGYQENKQQMSMSQYAGKREPLYAVGRNANSCSHCGSSSEY
jgi:hypothetical protein